MSKYIKLIAVLTCSILLVSCASTANKEVSTNEVFRTYIVKPSGEHSANTIKTVKAGDYILKEPLHAPKMVAIGKDVSFLSRNSTVGILGPKQEYKAAAGDRFYIVTTKRSNNVFCQLKKGRFFEMCLIDEDGDNMFDAHALLINTGYRKEIFKEKKFERPVPYSDTNSETGLYYAIRYIRGVVKPSFQPLVLGSKDRVGAKSYVAARPPKGATTPYQVPFLSGVVIEVLDINKGVMKYKIVKSIPKNTVVSMTR